MDTIDREILSDLQGSQRQNVKQQTNQKSFNTYEDIDNEILSDLRSVPAPTNTPSASAIQGMLGMEKPELYPAMNPYDTTPMFNFPEPPPPDPNTIPLTPWQKATALPKALLTRQLPPQLKDDQSFTANLIKFGAFPIEDWQQIVNAAYGRNPVDIYGQPKTKEGSLFGQLRAKGEEWQEGKLPAFDAAALPKMGQAMLEGIMDYFGESAVQGKGVKSPGFEKRLMDLISTHEMQSGEIPVVDVARIPKAMAQIARSFTNDTKEAAGLKQPDEGGFIKGYMERLGNEQTANLGGEMFDASLAQADIAYEKLKETNPKLAKQLEPFRRTGRNILGAPAFLQGMAIENVTDPVQVAEDMLLDPAQEVLGGALKDTVGKVIKNAKKASAIANFIDNTDDIETLLTIQKKATEKGEQKIVQQVAERLNVLQGNEDELIQASGLRKAYQNKTRQIVDDVTGEVTEKAGLTPWEEARLAKQVEEGGKAVKERIAKPGTIKATPEDNVIQPLKIVDSAATPDDLFPVIEKRAYELMPQPEARKFLADYKDNPEEAIRLLSERSKKINLEAARESVKGKGKKLPNEYREPVVESKVVNTPENVDTSELKDIQIKPSGMRDEVDLQGEELANEYKKQYPEIKEPIGRTPEGKPVYDKPTAMAYEKATGAKFTYDDKMGGFVPDDVKDWQAVEPGNIRNKVNKSAIITPEPQQKLLPAPGKTTPNTPEVNVPKTPDNPDTIDTANTPENPVLPKKPIPSKNIIDTPETPPTDFAPKPEPPSPIKPPTSIDSTEKTLYFKAEDAKALKEMGVGIRNVNIPGRKGQISVNKKQFESAVRKLERGEVPGVKNNISKVKPTAGKTINNTSTPETPTTPDKPITPTITKEKGKKPTIEFPKLDEAGKEQLKVQQLHAGFNPIGDNVAKETWGEIKKFYKRIFGKAGAVDDITEKAYVGTMEDIKEGGAIATEIGENLLYESKPKFGKKGVVWEQDVQQKSSGIIKKEYKTVEEFMKDTNLPRKRAEKLFKKAEEAREVQSYLVDEAIKSGMAEKEAFEKYGEAYMARMYRTFESHNAYADDLEETAKRLFRQGDPEAQKWADTYTRLANQQRHKALVVKKQDAIQKIKNDSSLWSQNKKQGFTYVTGEDWMRGKEGLSGLYVRDDHFANIKETINNIKLSTKKNGKYLGMSRDELSKGLDGSYLKQRKDLSEEYRQKLGEILEPAYPVAKRIMQMSSDVAKHKFYKFIAGFKGEMNNIGANMVKFDGKKWGALDGMYLPKDEAALVQRMAKEVDELMGAYNTTLSVWKESKTVWSPNTHARNVQNNVVNAWITYGISPITEGKRYVDTLKHFVDRDAFYDIARRSNVFTGNFNKTLMGEFLDNFDNINETTGEKILEVLSVRKHARAAYAFEDDYFKMMAFTKELEDMGENLDDLAKRWGGMSQREKSAWTLKTGRKASLEAREAITSYDYLPGWVNKLNKAPGIFLPGLGNPFISFKVAYLLKTIPKIIRKGPAAWGRFITASVILPLALKGLSDKMLQRNSRQEMEQRPGYMRNEAIDFLRDNKTIDDKTWETANTLFSGYLPLPFKDKYKRPLYLQTGYTLPWQDMLQTDDVKGIIKEPFSRALFEIAFNKNLFTGEKLFKDGDRPKVKAKKSAQHLIRMASPSFAPGGYSWEKWKQAIRRTEDYKGRVRDIPTVAMDTLLGLKATPVDSEQTATFKVRDWKREVQEFKNSEQKLMSDLSKNVSDPEKTEEEINYNREQILHYAEDKLNKILDTQDLGIEEYKDIEAEIKSMVKNKYISKRLYRELAGKLKNRIMTARSDENKWEEKKKLYRELSKKKRERKSEGIAGRNPEALEMKKAMEEYKKNGESDIGNNEPPWRKYAKKFSPFGMR